MEQINKIELKGLVGSSRVVSCGDTKICNFSLATNYCYKSQDGGMIIDTLWLQVVACGQKPEWPDLEKIQKGSQVHVIGRLRARRYCDSEGVDRTSYEVIAKDLKIVEG